MFPTRFLGISIVLALFALSSSAVAGLSIVADLDSNATNGPDSVGVDEGDTVLVRIWLTETDSLYAFGLTFGDTSGSLEWIQDTLTEIYVSPSGWECVPVSENSDGTVLLQATDFSMSTLLHTPVEVARLRFLVTEPGDCSDFISDLEMSAWMDDTLAQREFVVGSIATVCASGTEEAQSGEGGGREDAARPYSVGAHFIENKGQLPRSTLYYTARSSGSVSFRTDGILVDIVRDIVDGPNSRRRIGNAIQCTFLDRSEGGSVEGGTQAPGTYNFFLGDDRAKWVTGANPYETVEYSNVYEGIDIVYRSLGGLLKYDVEVAPGADLQQLRILYEGVDSLTIRSDETLSLHLGFDTYRETAPTIIQDGNDFAGVAYVILGRDTLTYEVRGVDSTKGFTIDPGLEWSTYLGGIGSESSYSLATDSSGNVVSVGETSYFDGFPTTPGSYDDTLDGLFDAIVTEINAAGNELIYSTLIGGRRDDVARKVKLDTTGRAFVVGRSNSPDFPTSPNAYDVTLADSTSFGDLTLFILSAGGDTLIASTFLGGDNGEYGRDLSLERPGRIIVTGDTASENFPTTAGAIQDALNDDADVFVSEFDDRAQSLLYSTYLGGNDYDQPRDLVVGGGNVLTICGNTNSSDFPLESPYDATLGGPRDGFITVLDSSRSNIIHSTYLGGELSDRALSAVADCQGRIVVAGYTTSDSFPTSSGAHSETKAGQTDGFLVVYDPDIQAPVYSTYIGGALDDQIWGVVVDDGCRPVIVGHTDSDDYPTTFSAIDLLPNGESDIVVSQLDSNLQTILYSTYIGGSGSDISRGGTAIVGQDVTLSGFTESLDFPVTRDAYDTSYAGGSSPSHWDVFLLRFPLGIQTSTPPFEASDDQADPTYLMVQPSPFNPVTNISYWVAHSGPVSLQVYSVEGRLIRTLFDGHRKSGLANESWNGTDDRGRPVGSGVYLVRLRQGGSTYASKITLLR